MVLSKKLTAVDPPTHFRRILNKWDRIFLSLVIIMFGVFSYLLPPTRAFGISVFWERSLYVEMIIAGVLGFMGLVGNWYWPAKISMLVMVAVFGLLTIFVYADGDFNSRGKLYVLMMFAATLRIYRSIRPYRPPLGDTSKEVTSIIQEFRTHEADERGEVR